MDSAATTRRLAALLDAASLAANGLQTTPEAVVSRENGRQRSTSSSDRSRQRNTSLASRIIHHELSDYHFLVDTGAFRSILPPSRDNASMHPSSSQLVAANGTSIRTYGEQEVSIRLTVRTYPWIFIIADVRHPLLGADFLSHFNLVVDVARHRLLNTDSFTSVPLCNCPGQSLGQYFRPTRTHHTRSWISIHIRHLVIVSQAAWCQPTPHNCVPLSGQWNGREVA